MAPQISTDPFASIATPTVAPAQNASAPTTDPFASIATPTPGAAPQTSASTTGWLDNPVNKINDTIGSVATGFAKGAGDTVSGVSHLLNKIPGVGETLAPSSGISKLDQMDIAHGTAEAAGKGLEGIAEWAAGDELLEGLSKGTRLVALAKKYPLINEVMGMAKDHPILAKIIAGGTVGATEGGVKGAQQNQAVKGALVGGASGAALGAVAGIAPSVVKAIPPNPFRSAARAFTGSDIQPTLKAGINDVWGAVAKTEGVAAPAVGTSVQDAGDQVADSILARSKANYKLIDDATGNRYSPLKTELDDANRAMRSVKSDAEEEAAAIRVKGLEMRMEQLMDDAADPTKTANPISQATIDAAKSDFKKAQAIYDVSNQVQLSTKGVRAGFPGAENSPEKVNFTGLQNRLNKLQNSGRLQQAIGDDAGKDMIYHTTVADKSTRDVARNVRNAKVAGKAVGAGGALIEGARLIAK
jgi:hypothetical protein